MYKKQTTATGLIFFFGFSAFANVSSSDINDEKHNILRKDLYAIEAEHISLELKKTRVDDYVNLHYNMEDNFANKYSSAEYGFLNVVQKFSDEQIPLDQDFAEALEELFISKMKAKPSKKRF